MTDDPDPSPWQAPPLVDVDDAIRQRQRGRAIVMAVLLGALVALIFFVTIAKIRAGMK
ncbi:MAG: hypothetical protein ACRYFW_17145 [Janthinobacterium lividum]